MRMFTTDFKNEDEMLQKILSGGFDFSIMDYLVEIMTEQASDYTFPCDPTSYFEYQGYMTDQYELLTFCFWDKKHSGVSEGWNMKMNHKQEVVFDAFANRINKIYGVLKAFPERSAE